MKARCDNPRQIGYENYGGRGITYEPRWAQFENFIADLGERPKGYSLERLDNEVGYCKENCRWIPKREQARNTRRNRVVELNGKEMLLCDAIALLRKNARWKYARA